MKPQSQSDSTNPKDKIGQSKPQLGLVPPAMIIHTAKAFENGAKKFGAYNWREYKVGMMTYLHAAQRHIMAILDGEDIAEDSGVLHAAHAAACMGIIIDAQETGNLIDDRPAKGPASGLINRLTLKKAPLPNRIEEISPFNQSSNSCIACGAVPGEAHSLICGKSKA